MELKLNEKSIKSLVYKLSSTKTLTIYMKDGDIIDAQVANIVDPMKYDVGRCQDSKKINNNQNCISDPHAASPFKEICQKTASAQKAITKNESDYREERNANLLDDAIEKNKHFSPNWWKKNN